MVGLREVVPLHLQQGKREQGAGQFRHVLLELKQGSLGTCEVIHRHGLESGVNARDLGLLGQARRAGRGPGGLLRCRSCASRARHRPDRRGRGGGTTKEESSNAEHERHGDPEVERAASRWKPAPKLARAQHWRGWCLLALEMHAALGVLARLFQLAGEGSSAGGLAADNLSIGGSSTVGGLGAAGGSFAGSGASAAGALAERRKRFSSRAISERSAARGAGGAGGGAAAA